MFAEVNNSADKIFILSEEGLSGIHYRRMEPLWGLNGGYCRGADEYQ